jgi:hypothetical protein
MHISAGWRLRTLYVKGMTITMAAGGAFNDSRDNLLMNDARRVTGRWLQIRRKKFRRVIKRWMQGES